MLPGGAQTEFRNELRFLLSYVIVESKLIPNNRISSAEFLVKVDREYGKVGCVVRTDECSCHLIVIQGDNAEFRVAVKDVGKGDGSVCRVIGICSVDI